MKYFYTLILSLALVSTISAKTYTIRFDKADYDINVNNGVVNIEKKNGLTVSDSDTEGPALPYSIYRILRPLNSSSADFKLSFKSIPLYENVKIEANPQLLSSDSKLTKEDTREVFASKSQMCPVKFLGDMSQYGFPYASFLITPFVYNIDSHKLQFITEVGITFPDDSMSGSKKNSEKQNTSNYTGPDNNFESYIREIIINSDELDTLVPTNKYAKQRQSLRTVGNPNVEYLIITSNNLAPSFWSLRDWKTQKGVCADLCTTSYIYSLYSNLPKALAIKQYLYDYYLGSNNNLKWVLLAGDSANVASPMCKIEATIKGVYTSTTTPCDYYYSCFSGSFNWDGDGDGVLGETTDNVDLSPYLYVSRAPVKDTAQANNFVKKVMYYEKKAPRNGYIDKMLLAGCWDPDDDDDRSLYYGKSRAHDASEKMYNIFRYNWVNYRDYQYDTSCVPSPYNLTNLRAWMNSGQHFVHMYCHGDYNGWSVFDANGNHNYDYCTGDVDSLTNDNPLIIVTAACNTSKFDHPSGANDSVCLGEAFIRSPHGAVVYVGSSRKALYYKRTTQLSLGYSGTFFIKLFSDMPLTAPHRLGSVMAETKKEYIDLCNGNVNGYRWLQYAINPFGDPEMPIYTGYVVLDFTPIYTFSGSDITVSVGNFDGVTISMKKEDGTYEVAKNVTNSHTFHNISSLVKFTITKDGFKAYESGDMYPTGNIFIAGPTLICDSALYSVVNLPSNAEVSWTNGLFSLTSRPNYPLNSQCMLINDHYNQFANPQFAGIYATISIPGIKNYILSKDIRISGWRYVSYTQYANGSYPYVSNTQASLNAPNYINPGCEIFLFSDNFKLMNITHSGVTPSTWSFNNNNSYLTFTLPNSSVGQTFTIHVRANEGEGDCNDFDISFIATTNSLNSQNSPQIEIRAAERGNYIRMASLDENSIWNLKVYNALAGESVINTEVQGASKFIDTSSWKPGVYIVRCQVGDKVVTEKMTVKQ